MCEFPTRHICRWVTLAFESVPTGNYAVGAGLIGVRSVKSGRHRRRFRSRKSLALGHAWVDVRFGEPLGGSLSGLMVLLFAPALDVILRLSVSALPYSRLLRESGSEI